MDIYSEPFHRIAGTGSLVLICDHASNAIPPAYGTLGLGADTLARHVAFDIGAAGVTRALAAALQVPAVLAGFSRLLIDPNRGADDPTLVMRLSDGAIIPGNAEVEADEVATRIEKYHAEYHGAIAETLAQHSVPTILSIHSFTPTFKGHKRPWDCAILWDKDPRLAVPLRDTLRAEGLVVGENQPYIGAIKNDCLYSHGTQNGFAHAIVEIRQDHIADAAGQQLWADRLARLLPPLLADKALHSIQHFGSKTD
ncbi:MAG: N-formylglutamate amidohydrolase [Alphaproteobacteria bacterium]